MWDVVIALEWLFLIVVGVTVVLPAVVLSVTWGYVWWQGVRTVMADKAWKATERRMARDVGTQRIPVTGERDGADFEDAMFAYQLKVRRVIPDWLWAWLCGIQTTGARKGKIGVLALKRPGDRDADALVILSWKDWVDLHGPTRADEV